jgi:acetoin utilization deacetylase AcuC-like enzyme
MFVIHSANQAAAHCPPLEVFEGGVIRPPFENQERVEVIMTALKSDDSFELRDYTDFGLSPILAVHTPDYVDFLRTAWDEWVSNGGGEGKDSIFSPVLTPKVAVPRRVCNKRPPQKNICARIGYYAFDAGAPIVEGTYSAAYAAAQCAITAVHVLLKENRNVFAFCRPPG